MFLPSEIIDIIPITNGRAKIFTVQFTVLRPVTIEFSLIDANHAIPGMSARPNTCYGSIIKTIKKPGKYTWDIKIPVPAGVYYNVLTGEDLAPKFIGFCFRTNKLNEPIGNYIRFKSLLVKDYHLKPTGFNKKEASYSHFLTELCLQMGYLPTGKLLTSKDGQFQFDWMDYIPMDDGTIHPTPMRIAKTGNYTQGSAYWLVGKPIPRRIGIGDHEYAHNNANTNPDSEKQADINGAKMFARQGWNEGEYEMAFERTFDIVKQQYSNTMDPNVLNESDLANRDRMDNLRNFYNRSNFLRA